MKCEDFNGGFPISIEHDREYSSGLVNAYSQQT